LSLSGFFSDNKSTSQQKRTRKSIAAHDGFSLPNTYQFLNIGGKHITDYLSQILCRNGHVDFSVDERIAREMKEKL
jgi:actin-related protein